MTDAYIAAIEKADRAVGMVLSRLVELGLMEKYHIILHSDHGGLGFHHNEDRPEVTTIPWIAAGPDIQPGYRIDQSVTVLDTAPTLARLLDIRPHHNWEGKAVDIFSKPGMDMSATMAA